MVNNVLLYGSQFKMKSEMHYGEADCPVSVADGFPKDDELHFEIELIDFAKAKARCLISNDSLIIVSNTSKHYCAPFDMFEIYFLNSSTPTGVTMW